ncbi:cation channel sperm-associated protein subunit delta [Sapajus apella]|uniref:Cation channel sperm-associated auxiliary subunit delta n=1 Tax=Sapajus apella TaxID=9515 RepID=A0A6J3FRH0_SAPAP|nr:cation channel sperm-associated protein subunit delta [Sapajus apella]
MVFLVTSSARRDRLSFSSTTPRLITHPCKKNIALYLGKQVFFTTNNFETSLLPFAIPTSMQVRVPEVTSAHFTSSLLLLVVAQKVYIYDYENDSWNVTFVRSGERLNAVFSPQGMFKYSDHPLNRSLGLSFDYNGTLDILIVPGQRGILLLWFEHSLLFSHNAGQLVDTVRVKKGDQTLFSSMFEASVTIHNIAVNENELAVITREDNLYYGNLDVVPSSVIKFADQPIWSEAAALMFRSPGMVEILTPLQDAAFPAFDFQKCLVNIQALLMDPEFHIGRCTVCDPSCLHQCSMHSCLKRQIQVMVSNPYSLGFQATFYESGHTLDGNTKYNLDICLKQQQHWGRTNPNFTSSLKRATISTVTVDIANKEISCVDVKPLSTLISIGCDLDKRIIIQNKISACSKGILDALTLQDNYSFIIQKEFYDPSFQGQPSSQDLRVPYSYSQLGCPLLVYYDTPWKPVVELWRKDTFQEIVDAEYVLLEVNGQFSYRYSLTAQSALCTSQPQNWTTMIKEFGMPFLWNRENYVSCHDSNRNATLRWPDVQYQILGGRTTNQIIFSHNNGIYIFYISIVDPYYSYCKLETLFSIYVYGAFPIPLGFAGVIILLLISSMLGSVWVAYKIPKLLPTRRVHRIRRFVVQLCGRCKTACRCFQFRASSTSGMGTEPPGHHPTPQGGRADH